MSDSGTVRHSPPPKLTLVDLPEDILYQILLLLPNPFIIRRVHSTFNNLLQSASYIQSQWLVLNVPLPPSDILSSPKLENYRAMLTMSEGILWTYLKYQSAKLRKPANQRTKIVGFLNSLFGFNSTSLSAQTGRPGAISHLPPNHIDQQLLFPTPLLPPFPYILSTWLFHLPKYPSPEFLQWIVTHFSFTNNTVIQKFFSLPPTSLTLPIFETLLKPYVANRQYDSSYLFALEKCIDLGSINGLELLLQDESNEDIKQVNLKHVALKCVVMGSTNMLKYLILERRTKTGKAIAVGGKLFLEIVFWSVKFDNLGLLDFLFWLSSSSSSLNCLAKTFRSAFISSLRFSKPSTFSALFDRFLSSALPWDSRRSIGVSILHESVSFVRSNSVIRTADPHRTSWWRLLENRFPVEISKDTIKWRFEVAELTARMFKVTEEEFFVGDRILRSLKVRVDFPINNGNGMHHGEGDEYIETSIGARRKRYLSWIMQKWCELDRNTQLGIWEYNDKLKKGCCADKVVNYVITVGADNELLQLLLSLLYSHPSLLLSTIIDYPSPSLMAPYSFNTPSTTPEFDRSLQSYLLCYPLPLKTLLLSILSAATKRDTHSLTNLLNLVHQKLESSHEEQVAEVVECMHYAAKRTMMGKVILKPGTGNVLQILLNSIQSLKNSGDSILAKSDLYRIAITNSFGNVEEYFVSTCFELVQAMVKAQVSPNFSDDIDYASNGANPNDSANFSMTSNLRLIIDEFLIQFDLLVRHSTESPRILALAPIDLSRHMRSLPSTVETLIQEDTTSIPQSTLPPPLIDLTINEAFLILLFTSESTRSWCKVYFDVRIPSSLASLPNTLGSSPSSRSHFDCTSDIACLVAWVVSHEPKEPVRRYMDYLGPVLLMVIDLLVYMQTLDAPCSNKREMTELKSLISNLFGVVLRNYCEYPVHQEVVEGIGAKDKSNGQESGECNISEFWKHKIRRWKRLNYV
ncbi:hypothetical protein BKA69DRAFT_1090931 [Paraphysoderma sedebokerense]|nr:hypothetical protein BKA69DRAFT_1093432 [Paraphysoderma sedebokerense]KAI9138610.1 hypothetical protein BKA69DRAFT_1090931 [Paraphysoderma sedebokerense]